APPRLPRPPATPAVVANSTHPRPVGHRALRDAEPPSDIETARQIRLKLAIPPAFPGLLHRQRGQQPDGVGGLLVLTTDHQPPHRARRVPYLFSIPAESRREVPGCRQRTGCGQKQRLELPHGGNHTEPHIGPAGGHEDTSRELYGAVII